MRYPTVLWQVEKAFKIGDIMKDSELTPHSLAIPGHFTLDLLPCIFLVLSSILCQEIQVHMNCHIFYRMGLWSGTTGLQLKSVGTFLFCALWPSVQ